MIVTGVVLNVDINIDIPKRAGGTYKGSRITFRGEDGKISEQAFTSQTLKYNPTIQSTLEKLVPGNVIEINKEKEGDFWNVKGIIVRGDDSPAATISNATPSNANTSQKSGAGTASRYDEENAKKQLYIIRQSCLSTAANTLGIGSKKVAPEDVMSTAAKYVDFVFNGRQDLDTETPQEDTPFDELENTFDDNI